MRTKLSFLKLFIQHNHSMKKTSSSKIVLAIDPGVRKLGYALVQDDMKIIDA